MRMKNKVAVVVGGTMGIGEAIVRRYAEEGANVVFTGRSKDKAEFVVDSCKNLPGSVSYAYADLGDLESIEAAVNSAVERFGQLDILCNVAMSSDRLFGLGATVDTPIEAWQTYFNEGVLGAVVVPVTTAIPHMIKAGGGSVVNVGSNAAIRGIVGVAPYTAGRGAQTSLTRHWAVEFHKQKIRFNNLVLSFTDTGTPLIKAIKNHPELNEIYSGMQLLGMGEPLDAAHAAVWLGSDESRWVTGAVIPVDGGASCYVNMLDLQDPDVQAMHLELS